MTSGPPRVPSANHGTRERTMRYPLHRLTSPTLGPLLVLLLTPSPSWSREPPTKADRAAEPADPPDVEAPPAGWLPESSLPPLELRLYAAGAIAHTEFLADELRHWLASARDQPSEQTACVARHLETTGSVLDALTVANRNLLDGLEHLDQAVADREFRKIVIGMGRVWEIRRDAERCMGREPSQPTSPNEGPDPTEPDATETPIRPLWWDEP